MHHHPNNRTMKDVYGLIRWFDEQHQPWLRCDEKMLREDFQSIERERKKYFFFQVCHFRLCVWREAAIFFISPSFSCSLSFSRARTHTQARLSEKRTVCARNSLSNIQLSSRSLWIVRWWFGMKRSLSRWRLIWRLLVFTRNMSLSKRSICVTDEKNSFGWVLFDVRVREREREKGNHDRLSQKKSNCNFLIKIISSSVNSKDICRLWKNKEKDLLNTTSIFVEVEFALSNSVP